MVEVLLAAPNINVNAAKQHGQTSLHLAAMPGRHDVHRYVRGRIGTPLNEAAYMRYDYVDEVLFVAKHQC